MIEAIVSWYASVFAPLFANDVSGSNSDATGSRAQAAPRPNRNSLRYLPPPGLAGWSALPERDRRLLEWLLVGEYLTAELAAALAYPSLRVAQRRLARLGSYGLLTGMWVANSQRARGRYAYRLTDACRQGLEALVWGERRPKRYPLGDASSIVHHLAVHDLMQVLLTAAQRDAGVVAWVPQRVSAALFDGYLRPDAIAAIRVRDRTILAFIEQDSGSERPPVLLAKLRRYRAVLGSRVEVEPAHILFVVPSARRLRSLREAFATAGDGGRPPAAWLALASDLRRDPWSAALRPSSGDEQRLVGLPSHPCSELFEPSGRHCLLQPEQAEAIDERGMVRLPMLDHFRRRSGM